MTDHHHEASAPSRVTGKSSFASNTRRIVGVLDSAIFTSRWVLYPINVGLFAALVLYVYKFICEDVELFVHAQSFDGEQIMVALLGLVDIAMVANLLIMIIQGSHQIFIRRLQISDPADRPQWLDHIDSGILKVKVSLSIASITLVQILKDFVNIEHVDWEHAKHRLIMHGVAVASAIAVALIWRITHPSEDSHNHAPAPAGNGHGHDHASAE